MFPLYVSTRSANVILDFFANFSTWQWIGFFVEYTIKIAAIGIVPEGRKPGSANAWLLLILFLPVVGLPLYLILGSTYVNRRRHRIQHKAQVMVEDVQRDVPDVPDGTAYSDEIDGIIKLNRRLTGNPALHGHVKALWSDYEKTMLRMAEIIDTAEEYVSVEVYIQAWDDTTAAFYDALERAVKRGVKVRLMFDHIGSWKYPRRYAFRKHLDKIGVDWKLMMPLLPWRGRFRRPDLRNHRKVVIVDGRVAFMGSYNLIDRSYLMKNHVKAGRQWIDVMVELTGPIVTSLEAMFAVDWYTESGETMKITPPRDEDPGVADLNVLQLIPSGPGYTSEPNLKLFNSMMYHARERLVICSPYFVPDESLLGAVQTACHRGVRVDLLVGEKADQFMVHHAQSAYYQQLLEAGVRIWEFPEPYILHTKFAIADPGLDSCVAVIGSSNMDMRSFQLNYENTLMVVEGSLLNDIAELAENYLRVCGELTLDEWNARPWTRRYIDNVMKLTSALQ
ncbi:Cardiolipin synthase [Corynebacterium cystitidis DSM 20524]|uniref:Cardiolipin synthase n=1 Tax=Corynebacterium cystitidis DSM 20524 TaxID=1121357 RepID=A0A1H9V5N7_9CORY|nr:Cardiolipin synthase [Corynebacterium cystitidis DSM 20524]SES16583.1 cardiolipin synthase [Corynebacterium cystitidis DSM 20524]SNV62908.1 cardiolipin synthase [Corynebacterium cystitidis]